MENSQQMCHGQVKYRRWSSHYNSWDPPMNGKIHPCENGGDDHHLPWENDVRPSMSMALEQGLKRIASQVFFSTSTIGIFSCKGL